MNKVVILTIKAKIDAKKVVYMNLNLIKLQ